MLKSWAWLTVVAFYVILASWYVHSERSDKIFNGDSAGYYAYLPAFAANSDHQFEELHSQEKEAGVYSNYRIQKDGNILNKYPIGVALLLLPFYGLGLLFGSGHFESSMQLLLLFGSTFYLGLAAFCFDRICSKLNYNRWFAALLFMSTNLIYYVVAEPLMSHVYSFSGFCVLIYLLMIFIERKRKTHVALIGLVVGLLIVIRPANAVGILMLPFILHLLGSNAKALFNQLSGKYLYLFWGLIPILLQCCVWYAQTGHFLVWSYANEGFNWLDPHIWDVWFSFKKGLFIYAPILLLLFIALVRSGIRHKSGLLFTTAFILISYVISCWWSWYYGDSFGHRAFIEFYPFIFLMILHGLRDFKKEWLMPLIAVPFFLLSFIQAWQYEKGIIHPNSMTAKKYAHIFLKTGDEYIACLGNEQEVIPFGTEKDFLIEHQWQDVSVNGQEYLISSEVSSKHELFIELSAKKHSSTPINYKGTVLTAQGLNEDGTTNFIKTLPYYDINTESHQSWTELHTKIIIPNAHMVRIYIWNRKHLSFQMKDISLKIYELKQK